MQNYTIQRFTLQDIPYIHGLQPADWGDISANFISYCTQDFCYPIKVLHGHHIIGLGCLICYQDSAWLAHIIVSENYRGQGIGKLIVNALIDTAQRKGIRAIHLIATDLGLPVYSKLGFQASCNYLFYDRPQQYTAQPISERLMPATQKHYAQILAMDAEIAGDKRELLIRQHFNHCVVYEADNMVQGYFLPTLGNGPLYAKTEASAEALMELKYSSAAMAVLPEVNTVGLAWLEARGFTRKVYTATRMTLSTATIWQPQHIFCRIGGNYG